MKKIFLSSLLTLLICFVSKSQLVINEYCCSNFTGLTDNFGNRPDWLELYNNGASTVNLTGWFLSDDPSNPAKWHFPSGSINAGGYVVVFLTNRDTVIGTNYHTNFKITQCKPEHLLLTDPANAIVDSFTIKPTKKDHSRARSTNGGPVWGLDTSPTPNASNSTTNPDYCLMVTYSSQGGFYPGTISLTLSSTEPNVQIRYTTNGLEPTASSTLYSAPINIAAHTVIRACAFPTGVNTNAFSMIETNTYIINQNFSIPVIAFSGDYNTLFSSGPSNSFTINSSVEYWDKNHVLKFKGYGLSDPHGNDSWAFPQKGFDFEVEDRMGESYRMNYPIFPQQPRPSYDHIIMKAAANDNYPFGPQIYGIPGAHIRDAFVQDYAQHHNLDMDYRTYVPAICFINGQYWGVYEIREKHDEIDYTNFYYNQEEKDVDLLAYWGGLTIKYGSDTAWNNLYNFMTTNNLNIPANFISVDNRLNLQGVIDYMIYCTYIVDSDWLSWNTEWWRGRHINNAGRNKWTYTLWDMDNTYDLGQNYTGWPTTGPQAGPCDVPNFSGSGPQIGHIAMFNALMATDTFKSMYIQRYADLMNTTLRCDSIISYLDTTFARIAPEMPGQITRWGGTMGGWQTNVTFLRNTVMARCTYIDSLLVDCYQLSGPYHVTVDVFPAGSGDVKVNTTIPPAYAYTGDYFGGVKLWLHAIPTGPAPFDHWVVNHHTIFPNQFAPDMYIMLTQHDTVTAYFMEVVPTKNLTVIPIPGYAGNINVEGITPGSYPYTGTYISGQVIDLIASQNTGYEFQYWEMAHHLSNPGANSTTIWFSLQQADTAYAHFASLTDVNNIDPISGVGVDVYPTINNGQFTIAYKLPKSSSLEMNMFDLSGKKIMDLLPPGYTESDLSKKKILVDLKALNLTEGVYFVNVRTPEFTKVYKIMYVKP